jgi:hypothetical protein
VKEVKYRTNRIISNGFGNTENQENHQIIQQERGTDYVIHLGLSSTIPRIRALALCKRALGVIHISA